MRIRMLALASVALVGVGLMSAPAQAVEKKPLRNCVMHASRPNAPVTCYSTVAEAISAASGGLIRDLPTDADATTVLRDARVRSWLNAGVSKGQTAKPARQQQVRRQAPGAILFSDKNYHGYVYVITKLGPCTETSSDRDREIPLLQGYWNDEVGSFKSYNGCWTRLFGNLNFGGAGSGTGFTSDMADLGGLDDEASSVIVT